MSDDAPAATPAYLRMMAAYNKWQNRNIYGAAGTLSDAARKQDRGAFFRSIHETLAHILWADEIWLSRFGACAAPPGGIDESTARYPAWLDLAAKREALDETLLGFADRASSGDLAGDLTWYSGAMDREITRPRALLLVHLFNHQTHHRGQVHAMLTAAGAAPGPTDLPFTPDLD